MSNFRQNENPVYDEFDPDNLDMDDIIKRRWKSKSGKVVGINKSGLPIFKKIFIDPKQLANQQMSDKVREFLKENEIAIKSLDGQPCPFPFLTWESTQFPPQIKNVINELNFRAPTPIQSVVFPLILSGYDVIGVAETGSGKTFGYLLPGLIQIKCQNYVSNFRDQINGPEMLILAPTRELVMQIASQIELFMKPNNLKVATAFGGQNRDQQASQIRKNPNILVACPGRLLDFLKEGILELSKVTYLVIDEADRLLDMGFEDDVRDIVNQIRQDRQTVFFSATWPKAVRNLSLDFCAEDPIYVQVGRSNLTINKNIDQEVICLYQNEKLQRLLDILDQLKINDKVLIFAETRVSCEQLSVNMTEEGYYAVALHGNKTQQQRDQIMSYYKKGETKLLCATDLASRGLDVSDITVVINYDFPKYFDDYIHRIGRTGRAGRKGRAISFFSFERDQPQMARELLKFNKIHKLKLDEQLMQDLAKGIRQRQNNNYKGIFKYDGQIMTHKNNSQFTVPKLSKEEEAQLYMQPHQLGNLQNRQSHYGRQDQSRPTRGQYHNKQNFQEELFYQDKYQNNQQRRQQQPYQSNKFENHNHFQGQRNQDYLDTRKDNNNRSNYQDNPYQKFGSQRTEDYQRPNQKWQNNQVESQGRYQDMRSDEQRGDRNDYQFRQSHQQGFPPQNRDQWNPNQRDQQQNNRFQQSTQMDQQNNEQRRQPINQFNQQNDQKRNPFNNDNKDYNQQRGYQPYGQGRDSNNFRSETDNYRNQNQRQYQDNNNRNKQGFTQNEYNQQKTNPPDNYRDRNQQQNQYQNYPKQDGNQGYQQSRNVYEPQNNQRYNNQQNDNNQRENNTRRLMDNNNKLQDDKDSSQQLGPNTQFNFNNFKPNEEQIQQRDKIQDNQSNLDLQGRSQNQRVIVDISNEGKDQEINPKIIPQQVDYQVQQQYPPTNRINENFKPNSNNYIPQIPQEQQFNQQFQQRQDSNNFVNERFQNQYQGVDRQYNQRSLLDQKMDQMINNQENQITQFNRQRQYQENIRQPQQDAQNFQRNERILDQQDDNENPIDFTRYPRQVDDNKKRFELEQIPKTNQQELRNSRKNSDQQQIQNLEQNTTDSQIQY